MGNNGLPANAGLKVGFEFPATMGGATTPSPILCANCIGYEIRGSTQTKPRMGRGDTTNFPTHRIISSTREGVATFSILAAQAFLPDDWRGKTVTLKVYYDGERYEQSTVKITGADVKLNEKTDNKPQGTIHWINESAEAFHYPAGSTNTGGTAEAPTTKQSWSGTAFSTDASLLSSAGQLVVDWYDSGAANTDAAELAELATYIAGASIPAPYKAKIPSISRDSIAGGTITIPLALTSTAEDWLFERTSIDTDSFNLKNLTVKGAIYTRGSEPSPPGASGLVLHGTKYFDITSPDCTNMAGVLWFYGETTTADEEIFPRSKVITDAQDLESETITGAIFTTGSPPSDPSAPSGLKIVRKEDYPLTNSSASNQSIRLYVYGKLDSKDRIELLESKAVAEPGNVRKESIVVKVLDTATPVTDNTYNPDTTNLEFYTDEVHQITAAGTNHFVHVITYKPLSPLNEDQEDFNQIADDPVSNLLADDHRRIEDASATTAAPAVTNISGASMVCVRRITKKIGHTKYRHDFWYKLRSVAAALVAERTVINVDASALESTAFTAEVFLISGGPAGAGSAPFTNALNIDYRDFTTEENPLYTLRVYGWGLVTNQQKLEYDNSEYVNDPLDRYKRIDATLNTIASTLGSSAYADSLYSANKSDLTFDQVSVKRITPTLALAKKITTGEDKKIHSATTQTILDNFRGKPGGGFVHRGPGDFVSGSSSGALVQVIAPGPVTGGPGGFLYGEVVPIFEQRNTGYFKLRRRIITTTARQPEDFYYEAKRGLVCSSPFCGYAKWNVMFLGAEVVYNYSDNDNHLELIDYAFKTDDLMFMNDGLLPGLGTNWVTNTGSLITVSGFYDPAIFSAVSGIYKMYWPTETSFSVFLA